MTYEMIFGVVNTLVLPAWLLLLVAPGWRWSQRAAMAVVIPLLAATYVGQIVFSLTSGEGAEGVDFTTMAGVAAIFSHPVGIVAGWTHFLAFDLLAGAWVARDGRRLGLPRLALAPCLILCFVAGPAGLLLYLGIRRLRRPRASLV